MTEQLDIDGMRALLAIERLGGVTRAAEQLALSQSAVSHKIRRLERNLGCDLLVRRSGRPLFTVAGERLLDYARRIVNLHDEALSALSRRTLSGSIQLGMTEDVTTSAIARILGRFTRLHPEITVRTRVAQSLCLDRWLDHGEIDVALMQTFSHGLLASDRVLLEDCLYWVKSYDYRLGSEPTVPFLAFDRNCFYKDWALAEGGTGAHQFDIVMECASASGVVSAVRSGMGVALLNGMHVTSDIEIIDGVFPEPPGVTYIARSRSEPKNTAVQALILEIVGELQLSNAGNGGRIKKEV